MRILYIASFKNLWDEEGIARSLESLGHVVDRYSEDQFAFIPARAYVDARKHDMVLFAKFKGSAVDDKKRFLAFLREKKIPSVCWIWDLYYGLSREHRVTHDPVFKCDHVFTPDGGNHQRFLDAGVNHHLLRQGIYEDYCFRGEPDPAMANDVVFVGCFNPQWPAREEVCNSLKGYDFKRYGEKDTLEVRGSKLNTLYASAKIVLGDSVYSPHYWSNRIYETLGRGGFLIHPMIEGLEKEYEPYKHFVPFKYGNTKSLHEKIDYYLSRPEERKRIADAAFEHTKKHHTVRHRCEELLKHL